jgi:glycosyltransferase involved in cell wall biosynthesis
MITRLVLITSRFPYDRNAETFLMNEIEYLRKDYDITIIPLQNRGGKRDIDSSIKTDSLFGQISVILSLFFILPALIIAAKELRFVGKRKFIKAVKYYSLSYSLSIYLQIKYRTFLNSSNVCFYSYWMMSGAIAIALLRKRYPKPLFITRAHRYDIYEDHIDNIEKYLPGRNVILNSIDFIVCVSEFGKNYLLQRYPDFKEKIIVSRLGTVKPSKKMNIVKGDLPKHIVTCSNIAPIKRLDKIIEVFSILSRKGELIRWTHIGDGPLRAAMEELAKTKLLGKMEFKFLGSKPNSEVLKLYEGESVDLFLNLSDSEGLPVSVMEAMSYGIPVLATNTGGIMELVTKSSGCLVDIQDSVDFVTEKIQFILRDSIVPEMRECAFYEWQAKANAEINYREFGLFIRNKEKPSG